MYAHQLARQLIFVLRCAGSASLAYLLASAAGLLHPLWAPMSALIVSQERLMDTWTSLSGRVVGTCMGLLAAVAVDALLAPWGVPMAAQISLAVALCAPVARRRPMLRVSMWTGPIVLLTPAAGDAVYGVAWVRGAEVILGSVVGVALHWASDRLTRLLGLDRAARADGALAAPGAQKVPGDVD